MKRKTLAAIALAVIAMSTITACGKQEEDTGVVISAGDTGYDTSKNDVITSDGKTNTETSGTKESQVAESEVAVDTDVSEEKFTLYGTWVSVDGNIFEFTPAGHFNGYMLDEQRNVNGTYVTDDTSYITVSETGRYEYVEVTLEDGTVDTEQVPLEDVQFDFKIVTATVGDDEATGAFTYLLTLEYNGKEIELRKDMDLESNYNANYYDYETAVSEDDTDGVSEETVDIDVNATSDDSILYEEQATDTVTVEQ